MSEESKNINEKQYQKRIQSRQKERKKQSMRNEKRGNILIHFFVVVSKKNILRKKPKPKTEEGDKKAK